MRLEELKALCEAHPIYIPVREAAKYLGVAEDCLRAAMDQNRCPFGFSWRLGARGGYKIPTIAFASWMAKGIPLNF